MSDRVDSPLSATVTALRVIRGWTRKRLAAALGVRDTSISAYENGKKEPSMKTLQRMVAVMGFRPGFLFRVLALVEAGRAEIAELRAADPETAERAELEALVAMMTRSSEELWRLEVTRFRTKIRAIRERGEARRLWERLRSRAAAERPALVKEGSEFHSWALCELLCLESERAAADSAARAVELADLALLVARLVGWEEAARQGLEGWAWAFVGNARRVGEDFAAADQAFAQSATLWNAGGGARLEVLDGTRLLDLEASLRREQGRLDESLSLLERALKLVPYGPATGRLLVIKAKTLEELGHYDQAIGALRMAEPLIDADRDPRLDWVRKAILAVNLNYSGLSGEAEPMLPALRALARRFGNQLDLLRQRWLEGQVAVGLGRAEQAEAALFMVRAGFIDVGMSYDAALVTIELAELYASHGRTSEVKVLVLQSMPVFLDKKVHREAQRALQLFRKAAEAEVVTAALARSLVRYLLRARRDTRLRFEVSGDLGQR
ncbi:MAG TPA: helix-turn-helix domain-containing protein [Thermoanaerobaculia bacterium]|nr:helix-turn-helix domain-containing protein [Thermoanaerobaculia bacterium]